MARHERWTAIVSAGLIFGALLACKKKGSDDAAASASAQVAPPPATTAAATGSLKLGDVKRYSDKEKKADEGAVRVLDDDLKVFNEADSKTPEVATLPKDALVFRLAEMDSFELVEFPSGIGQFSQGWVEKKSLATTPEKVAREAVLTSQKVAKVKTDGGAPSASGSASGSASASASAKPSASASTPPAPPAPPKPKSTDDDKKKKKKKKSGG
jgi:hypothetical protein